MVKFLFLGIFSFFSWFYNPVEHHKHVVQQACEISHLYEWKENIDTYISWNSPYHSTELMTNTPHFRGTYGRINFYTYTLGQCPESENLEEIYQKSNDPYYVRFYLNAFYDEEPENPQYIPYTDCQVLEKTDDTLTLFIKWTINQPYGERHMVMFEKHMIRDGWKVSFTLEYFGITEDEMHKFETEDLPRLVEELQLIY